MEPKDGMRIRTNTARLLKHRRMILELLLSAHCKDCTTCEKSGDCRLQELALRFGVRHVRFEDTRPTYEKDSSSQVIVRDPNKCILCGDCIRVCDEMQGMGVPENEIEEMAEHSANTVPCMMPYITAFFMPRAAGDRPAVVPEGAVNFAFLGQFAETKRDTIFTTEYSMALAAFTAAFPPT